MNLRKKKLLAAKTLKVGKERVIFVKPRLEEIKEAITKQDIKDLHREGAIIVRNVGGRTRIKKGRKKRGPGKVRKKVNRRKKEYIILTRKLRRYVNELLRSSQITKEDAREIRKSIRNSVFKSKAHLKEQVNYLRK